MGRVLRDISKAGAGAGVGTRVLDTAVFLTALEEEESIMSSLSLAPALWKQDTN